MNVVFLGTPEFAVAPLREILKSKHRVLAVVSQPDREVDKKGRRIPTATKAFAETQNLLVLQYEKVCTDGLNEIRALKPDVMITAAFGQILTEEFLEIAPVYNIHASLLPLYRGSSPIQSAILNGDTVSGVTIMRTVRAMDAGDILLQEKLMIEEDETSNALSERLSVLGAKLIVEALNKTERGELVSTPQEHQKATYTKKIIKADGLIDWTQSTERICCGIRAFNPWPCAYTYYSLKNECIKIYTAKPGIFNTMPDIQRKKCGEILFSSPKEGLVVQCGQGTLQIIELQAPGKRVLSAGEFLRGYPLQAGALFGNKE